MKILDNLRNHGFKAEYFETKAEACAYMKEAISKKTIGIGGSLTVQEMGLDKALAENNTLYWHWNKEQIEELGDAKKVRDLANNAEVYISSVNAISETGELVNIDGTGNRIAATLYGPKTVYFVVGKNKIAENLEQAMWRARNVAAPKNAQRLGRNTPCAVNADKCYDCNSKERICNGFLTIARPMGGMDMIVILVGEELGA